jgi:hypothetical protein
MRSSHLFTNLAASLVCAAGIANAAYAVEDTYNSSNFFNEFSFFDNPDPTEGFVSYANATLANDAGFAGYSDGGVYIGVDHTTLNPAGGRRSVRVTSNKEYTHGLFIADIAHMPGGICGVWPAFWTFGPNWPSLGEIDIIEGINDQTTDAITLHTSAGCTMSSSGSLPSSFLANDNCNDGDAGTGCSFGTADTQGYGTGFNAIGGGVYSMEWTSSAISVYFFPRGGIPTDITNGTPNPSNWGTPTASFSGSGCDIDSHFMNHNIVFDTTFCGQWAGSNWSSGSCASLANTCDAYVGANPEAFAEAYWMINSVIVYQDSGASKRGLKPVPFMA